MEATKKDVIGEKEERPNKATKQKKNPIEEWYFYYKWKKD